MKKSFRLSDVTAACLNHFGLNAKESARYAISRRGSNSTIGSAPKRRQLRFEGLEDRQLLSVTPDSLTSELLSNDNTTIVVNTLADEVAEDNFTSLREAIAQAQAGDTVIFDSELAGGTITLSGTELTIDKGITIDASSLEGGITVDGNNQGTMVFTISNGTAETPVELIGLTVTGGIEQDQAPYIYGGGIHSEGVTVLSNCILSGNTGIHGGGIYNGHNSVLTLSDCVISNNTSGNGGGIDSDGELTITNCVISNNTAKYRGGGIYNQYSATMTILNSTISDNTASSTSGGGIYNYGGILNINCCVISGNSAGSTNGGGIAAIIYSGKGSVEVNDTVLCANSASKGGAIYNEAVLTSVNSTISGNMATNGGGIYSVSDMSVYNSIVSLNKAGSNDNIYGTIAGSSNNLIDEVDLDFVEAPEFDEAGKLTNKDTLDLHIEETGDAINAGKNDYVVNDTDADGNKRIVEKIVDIGAYEHQIPPVALESITLSTYKPVYNQVNPQTITTQLSPEGAVVTSYQWYRGTSQNLEEMTAITGATESSYTYTKEDVGYYLRVVATGEIEGNTVTAVTSKPVREELIGLILSTTTPSVGEQITVVSPIPKEATVTYQWYRVIDEDDPSQDIFLTDSKSYTVTESDKGYKLKAVVTGYGNYTGIRFAETYEVKCEQLKSITISNKAPVCYETLTTTLDPDQIEATYQWYRGTSESDMVAITGAVESSYTVQMADIGYFLMVKATNVNDAENVVWDMTTSPSGKISAEVEFTQDHFTVSEGCGLAVTSETLFGENLTYHWTITDAATNYYYTADTTTDYLWVNPQKLGLESYVNYTVELYADSDVYLPSEVQTATLVSVVENPGLTVSSTSFADSHILKLDMSILTSGNQTVTNWEINWGDTVSAEYAKTCNQLNVSHYYTESGTYTIKLSTDDNLGKSYNYNVTTHIVSDAPQSDSIASLFVVESAPAETAPVLTSASASPFLDVKAVVAAELKLAEKTEEKNSEEKAVSETKSAENIIFAPIAADSAFSEDDDWTNDFSQTEEEDASADDFESDLFDYSIAGLL